MNEITEATKEKFIPLEYIPLDKSWIIRMGILDWLHGRNQIKDFFYDWDDLSDDLISLKNVVKTPIEDSKEIDVGESATLCRFVKFSCWKRGINPKIITHKTLSNRIICNDPAIIDLSQEELLKLDNKTSQWASAAVINGDRYRMPKPPHKLWVTYIGMQHWESSVAKGLNWQPIMDETIERHANVIFDTANTYEIYFSAMHSEDYCMLRAMDMITPHEGLEKWPSLVGHESNRIIEMEKALEEYNSYGTVSSNDHRVIQAIVAYSIKYGTRPVVKNIDAVKKSWPLFQEFITHIMGEKWIQ